MKLTVVLFLCVTSFVRVRGAHDTIELNIDPDQTRGCGRDFLALHRTLMNTTCSIPRQKLVTLKSEIGIQILPSQVYLKRCDCDYKCPDNRQCVPIQTAMKKQIISVVSDDIWKRKCLEVDLLEHTQCACECTKIPEDCNEYQHYVPELCSCMCNDEEKHERDCRTGGRVFNKDTCTCECATKKQRCSTGFTWSTDYCKCVKLEMTGETGQVRPIAEEDAAYN